MTITLSDAANGMLSNGGSYDAASGVLTVTGTAAAVTAVLDGLVFTPTAEDVAPGQTITITTTFTINDTDTAGASATDSTTTVIATDVGPRTLVWTGASDTNFANALNWDDVTSGLDPATGAPTAIDTAEFINGSGVITGTGTAATLLFDSGGAWQLAAGAMLTAADTVTVGANQSTVLLIDQGSSLIDAGTAVIANSTEASGSSVNVSGAGSNWLVGGSMLVGDAGVGSLNMATGGTVSATALDSGVQSTGAADIAVTDTASALTLTGQLTVGDASSADLSIFSGATVTAENADIGLNAGGAGVVDIEGSGSRLDITNNLNIGDAGTGVLVMGAGTTLSVTNGFGVGANGVFQQFGGVLDPSEFTNKGSVTGGDNAVVNVGSTLVNDGVYAATPGNYTLNIGKFGAGQLEGGTIAGNGSLVIGNSGDLIINAGTVVDTQSVDFNIGTTTGTLTIGTLVGFSAVIDSFDTGAEIILAGTSIVSESFVNNTLTLFGAGGADLGTLKFGAEAISGGYLTTSDGAIVQAPCFAAGTRIATPRGEVAVEALRVGDLVRTVLGDGPAPIIWIGRREMDCAHHSQPRKVWPVRVAAGAFGPGKPHADLFLSPDHAVYVEEVLIPVRHLINGSRIAQVLVERVTYYHLELAEHDVLLAEGLPAESYLDIRDGSNYANRSGPTRLYPDYAARMWEAFGCARLIVTGPELAAARALVERVAVVQKAA